MKLAQKYVDQVVVSSFAGKVNVSINGRDITNDSNAFLARTNQGRNYAIYYTYVAKKSHITGDINDDGKVNNKDLTRLFQYLSDWDVTVNSLALDVNGDGKVNNKDLTRLFQYLSDWNVEIF